MLSASIGNLIKSLVQAAISDRSECVRCVIFDQLLDSPELDISLWKYQCVPLIYPGLGDSSFTVRYVAIQLIGRLGMDEEDGFVARPVGCLQQHLQQPGSPNLQKRSKIVEPVLKTVLYQILQQLEIMPENDTKQCNF